MPLPGPKPAHYWKDDDFDQLRAGIIDLGVNVKQYGAKGDGTTDDSPAIGDADATGRRVYYPSGTYLYPSASNPTFAGGIEREPGATWRSSVVTDTLAFDGSSLVGLHHNHLQQVTTVGGAATTNGAIVAPPLSKAAISGPVDVIAHWYNDNGLDATRAYGGNGITWYNWDWNHVGTVGYDSSRHPLLGWYRGDDLNVLDWQCYWLREYGVTAIIPSETFDTTNWSSSSPYTSARTLWIKRLYNDVPNARALKIVPWVAYSGTPAAIATNWTQMIALSASSGRGYTVQHGGKAYLTVFLWDEALFKLALGDAGATTTAGKAFLAARATEAKAAGYAGLMVLARNASTYTTNLIESPSGTSIADAAGWWMIRTSYGVAPGVTTTVSPATGSYADYLTQIAVPATPKQVVSLRTSAESKNHPSNWTMAGSTPALFESFLKKAIDQVLAQGQPRIVAIYNVAEWAEGGPGLQPNRRDGFGYLQAVKNALTASRPVEINDPLGATRQAVDSAQIAALPHLQSIRIYSTFSLALTGVAQLPTLSAGYDGQRIRLTSDPVVGSYNITLADNATTAGTALYLLSPSVTLRPWDSIDLEYSASKGGWVQTSGSPGTRRTIIGTGAPGAGVGIDGDFYQRQDGTAAGKTLLYHREGGAWVAVVP